MFLGLILIFIISSTISIGVNWLNKLIINEIMVSIDRTYISSYLYIILITYLLFWLISNFIGYMEAFANNLFRLKVDVFVQKLLMVKSIGIEQEKFYDTEFIDKYSFLSKYTYNASVFIFKIISILFSNLFIILSSCGIFLLYEPMLVIYLLFAFAIQAVKTMFTVDMQFKLSKRQNREERKADYFYSLFTNKSATKEIRVFKFDKFLLDKWRNSNDKNIHEYNVVYAKREKYEKVNSIINTLIRFISIFVLLFSVRNGKYDIGTFVMLLGLTEACVGKTQTLAIYIFSGIFNEMKYFKDYYDIVFPISNAEIKAHLKTSIELPESLCAGTFENLQLNNISFSYPAAIKKAVDNVSLNIKKGEIVSILGYNGSGKTTLSKLIYCAFSAQEGHIKLNGTDTSNYTKSRIFKYYGILPQEFPKFSISIRETVGLGCIEKMNDMDEIKNAYDKAHLYKIINKYERKDETIIGKEYDETGIELSGGEMQRVVLASAYMGNPEILVLDEPTASIDPLREAEMLDELRENLNGKTAILISHRISFARLADRIIMMKDGQIVEEGSHDDLLKQNGYYAEMYYMQKKLYE